jgi:hypothetical protein
LVSKFEGIGDRYFDPILAFILLGILNGLQQISEAIRPSIWRQVLIVTPLIFLVMSNNFHPADLLRNPGKINYPPERQLWKDIDKIQWTQSSSHFYSDGSYAGGGFVHQIYSGKLQSILWDPNVLRDPEKLMYILSNGVNPFILVVKNGPDATILDEMMTNGAVPLEKISFPDTGFGLYYLKK